MNLPNRGETATTKLYDAPMERLIMMMSTLVLTLAVGCGIPGVSAASPGDDAAADGCTFTLSTPQRVLVSGVEMVTATMSTYPCTGEVIPTKIEACVEMEGGDSPGQCAHESTMSAPVQVYFSPYRKGATYSSRGTGCIGAYEPPFSSCESIGPKSATL